MNLTADSLKHLHARLREAPCDSFARQSGWLQRTPRKITPFLWLQALFFLVSGPYMTLRHCAWLLSLLADQTISKQAVFKRMHAQSADFLQRLLGFFISRSQSARRCSLDRLSSFKRILIQDSVTFQLPARLAHRFPGCVNQTKARIAILRVQAVFDLLSESFIHFSISPYTRNDQRASADLLPFVRPGDLVIRDLGYYVLDIFAQFISQGVFFISRLRPKAILREPHSLQPFSLLKRVSKTRVFDQWVLLGRKGVRVRLLAIPLPPAVAEQRRRKAHAKRDKRNHYSKEYYALLGWQILVTNVPAEQLSAQEISDLYGFRWQIELIFKTWKSHLRFECFPQNASVPQVETLVYAQLILATIFYTTFWHELQPTLSQKGARPLSMLKVASLICLLFGMLVHDLLAHRSDDLVQLAFCQFAVYDKRKQINYAQRRLKLG